MRKYYRHPTDVPIRFLLGEGPSGEPSELRDVGEGGLSFRAAAPLTPGAAIRIRIAVAEPVFEADGVVVWCRAAGRRYEIGVRFHDLDAEYGLRLVEQVCHIEHYRREMHAREGRQLSGEEAAAEWIQKYAAQFPR